MEEPIRTNIKIVDPIGNSHVRNPTELAQGREQNLYNENPDQAKPEVHLSLKF
jgi:hypothetical protein